MTALPGQAQLPQRQPATSAEWTAVPATMRGDNTTQTATRVTLTDAGAALTATQALIAATPATSAATPSMQTATSATIYSNKAQQAAIHPYDSYSSDIDSCMSYTGSIAS